MSPRRNPDLHSRVLMLFGLFVKWVESHRLHLHSTLLAFPYSQRSFRGCPSPVNPGHFRRICVWPPLLWSSALQLLRPNHHGLYARLQQDAAGCDCVLPPA
jgi:hypothetical protein